MSPAKRSNMTAARRVYTEEEVEDLVSRVLNRKKKPPTEDVEKELRKQDTAILRGELAGEKRERVRAVARNPEATASVKKSGALWQLIIEWLRLGVEIQNPVKGTIGGAKEILNEVRLSRSTRPRDLHRERMLRK